MKAYFNIILLLFALSIIGCDKATTGNLMVFDVEKAIDTPRQTDLTDLASAVEYIPLDDSRTDALISRIKAVDESKTGFYVLDEESETPVKLFDRKGGFLSTRGSVGRGPGEYMGVVDLAVDYDTDNLFLIVTERPLTPLFAYDADGDYTTRTSIPLNVRNIAFHSGQAIVLKSSPHNVLNPSSESTTGTDVPLIEVFSSNLEHEQTIHIVDKGPGGIVIVDGNPADLSSIRSIDVSRNSLGILSANGENLTVKDERGDTVYYYRDRVLEPAYLLDFGRYTPPDHLFGVNPPGTYGDFHQIQDMFEGDRYIFLSARGNRESNIIQLILDKEAPAEGGFTAVGPGGAYGLFLGGIAFTPMYVRDGRLVGWLSALDIVDNAAAITDPELRALAATLREDSNPVIVVATLKK